VPDVSFGRRRIQGAKHSLIQALSMNTATDFATLYGQLERSYCGLRKVRTGFAQIVTFGCFV
jgi:hypothetical protein